MPFTCGQKVLVQTPEGEEVIGELVEVLASSARIEVPDPSLFGETNPIALYFRTVDIPYEKLRHPFELSQRVRIKGLNGWDGMKGEIIAFEYDGLEAFVHTDEPGEAGCTELWVRSKNLDPLELGVDID